MGQKVKSGLKILMGYGNVKTKTSGRPWELDGLTKENHYYSTITQKTNKVDIYRGLADPTCCLNVVCRTWGVSGGVVGGRCSAQLQLQLTNHSQNSAFQRRSLPHLMESSLPPRQEPRERENFLFCTYLGPVGT